MRLPVSRGRCSARPAKLSQQNQSQPSHNKHHVLSNRGSQYITCKCHLHQASQSSSTTHHHRQFQYNSTSSQLPGNHTHTFFHLQCNIHNNYSQHHPCSSTFSSDSHHHQFNSKCLSDQSSILLWQHQWHHHKCHSLKARQPWPKQHQSHRPRLQPLQLLSPHPRCQQLMLP